MQSVGYIGCLFWGGVCCCQKVSYIWSEHVGFQTDLLLILCGSMADNATIKLCSWNVQGIQGPIKHKKILN